MTANIQKEPITSRRNQRIVDTRKLEQKKYRQRQGRFRVEGLQLLHMALDAGKQPLEVFFCETQFAGDEAPRLLERFQQAGAELIPVTAPVMDSLSDREVCQGLVVTFPLWQTEVTELSPGDRDLVVVLDRLQDPGNVGTLVRTADAVGAAAVVLIEPCADPFDPKTVRSSMGSLFNLPVLQTDDADGTLRYFKSHGLAIVGADVQLGQAWGAGVWRGGTALVLGNEARGISADIQPLITDWVRLPIVGKAESLNVAVAGGVLMYAWLRVRLGQNGDAKQRTGRTQ